MSDNLDVLRHAQEDVLYLQERIAEAGTLATDTATKYRRCCVVILLQECGLPPEAVSRMTVQDWLGRRTDQLDGQTITTGNVAYHICTLTGKTLDIYYNHVRPSLLPKGGKKVWEFLVGQGGLPLYNPLCEISRLQEEYAARRHTLPCDGNTAHEDNQEKGLCDVVPTSSEHLDVVESIREKMLHLQQQLMDNTAVSKPQCTDFRRYCQALLMERSSLTTKAITELDVQSWLERTRNDHGSVLLASAGCTYSVTEFTDKMLQTYFQRVRPKFVTKQRSRENSSGAFFVSDGGVPLKNPWVDASRLKAKYVSGRLQTAHTWADFSSAFPVTPQAVPPNRSQCRAAGFSNYRPLYKKWLGEQKKSREQYAIAQAQDRRGQKPTLAAVQRKIVQERWPINIPNPERALQRWVPRHDKDAEMEQVLHSVLKQQWNGLQIKNFGPEKGKGVIAILPFKRHSIVCDYHGMMVSASQGKMKEQSGYSFFFRDNGGKSLCIDATEFPCQCHPNVDTFGRRLNHSRKNPNVKPKVHVLESMSVILFQTVRDIEVGEELLWDYGVSRRSFGGEGANLTWLDS